MSRALRRPGVWLAVLLLTVVGLGAFWYKRLHGEPAVAPTSTMDADDDAAMELPEAEREFLWQVEHHGNLLSQHGFTQIADALGHGDEKDLTALLAADFAGTDLHELRESRLHSDFVDVVRRSAGDGPPTRLDRASFVARLLEYRRIFARPPSVKLSVMGLAPVARDALEGRWAGTCQLRIWGEHAPGKPAEAVVYLRYEVQQPTRATLERGGWLTACAVTQAQLGTAERYLLRECAAERGIDPSQFHDNWKPGAVMGTVSGGVYLCDFDRDGWLDVLITDFSGVYLYKGLPGGRFQNETAALGLPAVLQDNDTRSVAAAFVDLDGDGWEDLILGDAIYRNEDGKRFVNVTARSNLRLPQFSTGIAVADFDRDGKMDLYVTRSGHGKASSWLSGKSGLTTGNQLWRNLGNWQFENITARSGTDGDRRSTFTAAWLDANNDGWPDLFVPNEFGNGVLYVNNGDGTFHAHELSDRPCDFGTMGVTCGDIDNDGRIDIYCANMYSKAGSRVIGNLKPDAYPPDILAKMRTFATGSQLHLNRGGRWEQKGRERQVADAGWAYGAALVDLDNDGWLDIHATAGYISKSRAEPDG